MNIKSGASASANSLGPKKVIELFYITHPRAPKALMGPFLTGEDAECGRIVMRSADAVVTSSLVDSIDELTRWHGVNNGAICRAFAGNGDHHD
ncbi:hypothetical protein QN382_03515 [Pseudomonas sp. 10B1]|uniref:hypothetical protein n=1 Tax=unclassified Pseudomonas TaxID=196821 RepID=UPI002B23C32B|nr:MULTISPECIES: hypothetical protein [unclassified Pseudomonas]MEA9997197.1 hypothetical protein [Pseudomonas sp. AA4]MEB0088402.1 hypothetical protein [Pseudomonas sp. RTI1]MEB0128188.1 hypothetical protein [Pseudomonas sp. CCC1.2]MEB0155489.1 hypothetical protein [Pseudomonas sp. CCC4.3]MEB0181118.1 hypothetical protein [Pseudomonas sp. CCC3.2]